MITILELRASDAFIYILGTWLLVQLLRTARRRGGVKTTLLRGPPSEHFFFGVARAIRDADDPSALTEQWANKYGSAFRIPIALGSSRIILFDPQAVTYFYSRETTGYIQTPLGRAFIERLFGRGLLWAEGESHRRQRKALSPAFSNAAIRRLTTVFYDSSYKLKDNWDAILNTASREGGIIDVQKWMNHVSLDSIGIAGFGHNFGSLDGNLPIVVKVFESLKTGTGTLSLLVDLLSPVLPFLLSITPESKQWSELHVAMAKIADDLLERSRRDRNHDGSSGEKAKEKSLIGLLIKAESAGTQLPMTQEEIMAQSVLLLAGYETTSISLTWALIELARKPEKQQKLREELSQFSTTDPTWEQLVSDLPFLDAVVHEVLRLHPPVSDTNRIATEDDIIPLSTPVVAASGEPISSIVIKKGTLVSAPIRAINRSETFWGLNAKDFEPERWLEDAEIPANQFQGHRHILTFSDGPRICLGKSFALAEFKATLCVLIQNYTFELPGGADTKIETHNSILPRPKVAGEDGAKVPMRVRCVN